MVIRFAIIKALKAIEFESRLHNDRIQLPPDVARQVPEGCEVRVILLLPSRDEGEDWRSLGFNAFSAAYADEDAVYEDESASS
jgi:hypothetical protein